MRVWTSLVLWGALLGAVSAQPLYVARDGNDAWSGTLAAPNAAGTDGPLATLTAARDAVRSGGRPGVVRVRAGVYFLPEPLELGPADRGRPGAPNLWLAYPGERPVLSGGAPVTAWRPYRGRIMVADVAHLASLDFDQLYYAGRRCPLARVPNLDPQHPRTGGWAYCGPWVERGSKTLLRYRPQDFDPTRWANPQDAQVDIFPWMNWTNNVIRIAAVDPQEHVLTLVSNTSYQMDPGNRFYVRNVFEELDAPGEWYLDRAGKLLYFWPPDGRLGPGSPAIVPQLPGVVHLKGTGLDQPVEHLRLGGFTIAHSGGDAVYGEYARHCQLGACTVKLTGADGLRLHVGCSDCQILGNDVSATGHSGIALTSRDEDPAKRNWRIEISNNWVHHVGEVYKQVGGIDIWCDGPRGGARQSHVAHNLVHDTPRWGITCGGNDNLIEYNRVHHNSLETADTGTLEMCTRDESMRGNTWRYNWVSDTGGYGMIRPGLWEYPHYCWAVYLDDWTSGTIVHGNYLDDGYLGAVHIHGGHDNIITSNWCRNGLKWQIQYSPIRNTMMKGNRVEGNLFVYELPNSSLFQGNWDSVEVHSDTNVIYCPEAKINGFASFADWQAQGYDTHSVVKPLAEWSASPSLPPGADFVPRARIGLFASPLRASWPVNDQCWRETPVIHPDGKQSVPEPPRPHTRKPAEIPQVRAPRLAVPPTLDGKLDEWPADQAQTMAQAPLHDYQPKSPSRFWVGYDDQYLYFAVDNPVANADKLRREDGQWGQDDGLEFCFQGVSGGRLSGPIYVVRCYPSGKVTSDSEAGATLAQADKLLQGTQVKGAIGADRWCAEGRIAWAAANLTPVGLDKLLLNVAAMKSAAAEWVAWVGAFAQNWVVQDAGELRLQR